MTMLYNGWCEPVPDTRPLFKELISQHAEDIKTYMRWDNYTLNDTTIPVVELLKDHAIVTLMNSYGLFHVEQDILEPLCADVFIYFPILMQQLAITRLVDAFGVKELDTNIVTTTRSEHLASAIDQAATTTLGTKSVTANDATNTQNSTTDITNVSDVESTGTRNVNLQHNMPEQSINGENGSLPTDPQGTPILTTTYVQGATEGFSTSNPIATTETSHQAIVNTNTGSNDSTTTNSGADNSDSTTTTDSTNTVTEEVKSVLANKQYSYEIKAFLETADSLIAFSKWEDRFTWVVGIL